MVVGAHFNYFILCNGIPATHLVVAQSELGCCCPYNSVAFYAADSLKYTLSDSIGPVLMFGLFIICDLYKQYSGLCCMVQYHSFYHGVLQSDAKIKSRRVEVGEAIRLFLCIYVALRQKYNIYL